jgi:hypothetical protein
VWNWSRSDLFFALPFYHAGVRVKRPLGDSGWTAIAMIANGWNNAIDNNHVPSVAYTNLQLTYRPVRRDRLTAEVFLNITNLLDRNPPRAAAFVFTGSTYTNTQLFDIYGRQYTLGARVQF